MIMFRNNLNKKRKREFIKGFKLVKGVKKGTLNYVSSLVSTSRM